MTLVPREELDSRYFKYQLIASRPALEALGQGATFVELASESLRSFRVVCPPAEVQQVVADLLDRETARIDSLAARRRMLRRLLVERWKSEVRAIVAGAPGQMDDGTRSSWLGPTRAEWPVMPLGRLVHFFSGTTFPPDYQGVAEGDYPFVKVADLAHGDGVSTDGADNWVSASIARELRARIVPAGSILYPRVGAALLLNQRRVTSCDVVVDDNLRGIRFQVGDPVYWQALLSMVDLAQFATPGLVPSIGEGAVASIPVPCPPDAEQRRIVATLERRRATYGALSERLREQLSALREHRYALITAAVTGVRRTPDRAA